ncbi:plasma-membrane calcium-translocating P-type ATPase [Parelusimicrobium proximum]|uniref:cation-transporting P-type ATPase n=1 Tax=Parelusimicrobium proximum TaxID=3228953 RepID=UPI003D18708D
MRENLKYENKNWYNLSIEDTVKDLATDLRHGLSQKEAQLRLEQFGRNVLPQGKKKSLLLAFLKQFHNILIYVLFAAAVVTAFMGHYVDTIVIILVAFINAVIGFSQERKAEKALENIKKMLSPKALVLRDNDRTEIDAANLVAGDIVFLNPGDKVPADLRLVKASNLKIIESALTGESVPSEKKPDTLKGDVMLGDRDNMAFSSTSVSSGTGIGIVSAVGKDTEIGKINQMLAEVEPVTTPLLKQINAFSTSVSVAIVVIAAVIFVFGFIFRSYETTELLLSVIGLAIAAIPEGLPAIVSIILAIGVQNMAKRKAIVRNMPAVETLGSVSVICTDKTGTLTKNEMTVKVLCTREYDFEVTGTGYAPEGDVLRDGEPVHLDKEPVLYRLLECFNTCNDANLGTDEDGHWTVNGDPTEGALVTAYRKIKDEHEFKDRLSTIPFDSEYKYMAVLIEGKDKNFILIKGAPDVLLKTCDTEETAEGTKPLDKEYWEQKVAEIAGKGQRTMGAAIKIVDKTVTEIHHQSEITEGEKCGLNCGVIFLGLAGIIDPPRDEATDAIKTCHTAGIRVKMITGDHITTALAIAKEMGIGDGTNGLQGKDIEAMSDDELKTAAWEYDVFARTSPEHKLRLVKALKARGAICAMTGDGVNDAPALKASDVGIAMGIKGTEVTKDAAEIVLTDDNFATIVNAVEEGRRVYDNLKKTILFILPTNGAEAFLIAASILFATLMPLTPVQILWVNMVTSVTISFALAFEPAERGVMNRPPRPEKSPLLSGYFIWRIAFLSVLIGGGTLWMNVRLLGLGISEDIVRSVTIQTIVFTQMFHLFNSRSVRSFAVNKDFFTNKAVFGVCIACVALQLAVAYVPFMNSVFGTVPLELTYWKYPLIAGAGVFIIVEIEKAVMRAFDRMKAKKK